MGMEYHRNIKLIEPIDFPLPYLYIKDKNCRHDTKLFNVKAGHSSFVGNTLKPVDTSSPFY